MQAAVLDGPHLPARAVEALDRVLGNEQRLIEHAGRDEHLDLLAEMDARPDTART